MIVGKVIGSIVSTRKNENLVGNKFMVVEPLEGMGDKKNKIVAIDNIGAGIGELVLVALGSAARIGCGMETSPVDAAIVGIVDDGIGMSGVIKK
ncbi:MAG: EutN/CcmL family microcompartment protein [Clostridia bacterium]|nr:EutN/CcmL family microcompartment protein [Clostridia bacterium]